jgi:hypothetical protein
MLDTTTVEKNQWAVIVPNTVVRHARSQCAATASRAPKQGGRIPIQIYHLENARPGAALG